MDGGQAAASRDDMVETLKRTDWFLSASRGEGFTAGELSALGPKSCGFLGVFLGSGGQARCPRAGVAHVAP